MQPSADPRPVPSREDTATSRPSSWGYRLSLAAAFFSIYIIWGTSYLGIRIAVRGMPPAMMSGLRFLTAGILLLAVARAGGMAVVPPRRSLPILGGIGILLILGNFGVVWSEQYITSGVAALIFATAPLCIAAFSAFVSAAERLTARTGLGLALGIAGVGLLVWPKLSAGVMDEVWGEAGLVLAVVIWSLASVWAKHAPLKLPPFVSGGWQMLLGGVFLLAVAVLRGEPARVRWDRPTILAFSYLTICGSCMGYGSYIWLLHRMPAARVATFAFVNPVVAVVLGWLLLDETPNVFVVLGTLVIVPAIVLTVASRRP